MVKSIFIKIFLGLSTISVLLSYSPVLAEWTEPVQISFDQDLYSPRAIAVGDTIHVLGKTVAKCYYLRSNDNGETWTEPIIPATDYSRSDMADIIFTGNCLHIAFIGRLEPDHPIQIFHILSYDGGRSWEEPNRIYTNAWKYPRLAACGDTLFSSWIIPGYILVSTSFDNGETWNEPVYAEPVPGTIDCYPNILYFQGRLHLIYQINFVGDLIGVEIFHRYSDDFGLSWSDRYPLSTLETYPTVYHSQFPSAYIDETGKIISFWFDYKYGSACGFTGDILGRISLDNGDSWPQEELKLTDIQTGMASSCLILTNKIYAVWEDLSYFYCQYSKLTYTESTRNENVIDGPYDWTINWNNPEIISGYSERSEHCPVLLYTALTDTIFHCVLDADDPNQEWSNLYYLRNELLTGIDIKAPIILDKITLLAYPNPFNSSTTINYSNIKGGEIEIYDICGRLLRKLDCGGGQEGKVTWDATDASGEKVSSGIYFTRARTPQGTTVHKLILLK